MADIQTNSAPSYYPAVVIDLFVSLERYDVATEYFPPTGVVLPFNANKTMFSPQPLAVYVTKTGGYTLQYPTAVPAGVRVVSGATSKSVLTAPETWVFRIEDVESVSVDRQGVQAAKMSAAFKWEDMPIDPRMVRSCGVKVYMGTVRADDFSTAISNGDRAHLLPVGGTAYDENLDTGELESREDLCLRFSGFIDKWTAEWSGDVATVSIEARDISQLLLDQEHPPGMCLDISRRLDEAIAVYLSNFPAMAGITVFFDYGDESGDLNLDVTPPKLSEGLLQQNYIGLDGKPLQAPSTTKKSSGASHHKHTMKIWDYLNAMTQICGYMLHFTGGDGLTLRLCKPQTFYSSNLPMSDVAGISPTVAAARTSFHNRALLKDYNEPYRLMVWGRNVESVHMARNFDRKKPTTVKVQCWDAANGKAIVSYFPTTNKDAKGNPIAGPWSPLNVDTLAGDGESGDGQKNVRVINKLVSGLTGVAGQKLANDIATAEYQHMGRKEYSIEIKTKDLASYGADDPNDDPDLLDLFPGDCFDFIIYSTPDEQNYQYSESNNNSEFQKIQRRIFDNRAFERPDGNAAPVWNTPSNRGNNFGEAYIASMKVPSTEACFVTPFRVHGVKLGYGPEGFEITVIGINMVTVMLAASVASKVPSGVV